MANISTQQATQYAQSAGFTGSGLATIVAIATCESGLNPNATNTVGNTPQGSVDRGIIQFNSYWHKDVSDACAFNPQCSFQAAYRVTQGGTNFSAWNSSSGCWKSGRGVSNIPGTSASQSATSSTLSNLPYGIGDAISAVQQTFVNWIEEVGLFVIAAIVIILGVIILNSDEIKGLSKKVGTAINA